jgi:TP901 family phage tail tape measure protein
LSEKGKEYELGIKINGEIDESFNTSFATSNKALQSLQKSISDINKDLTDISKKTTKSITAEAKISSLMSKPAISSWKTAITGINQSFDQMDRGFDRIAYVGVRSFGNITKAAGVAAAAIGAAAAGSIATGTEFETAFTGVLKTVQATEEEYVSLRQNIRDMTKVIPAQVSEISGVMETAGQLGIAKESLTDFTETMINMGVSTNLVADEAATSLAQFANIVSMEDYDIQGISNYERLGSTVVDLGNNFATTEADIVAMSTRLASTGDLVNLSAAEIMALSTAMSSMGIESEAGGSAMSKLLKDIQVATELGGSSLTTYASIANMTTSQFKESFQEDAVGALTAFIEGIDDVERNGKSAIVLLDELGLNEVRLSNTILALAGGEDILSNSLQVANNAWEQNTALSEEAAKRYATADSQLQIMQNNISDVGITAYDELRDPYLATIQAITQKTNEFNEYLGGSDGISDWIRDIGTKLPTLRRQYKKYGEPVFDALVNTGEWVIDNGDGVISVIAGVGGALATYKVASSITSIVSSLAALSPASWGILAATGAIAGLTGVLTQYKLHEWEMIDDNLADHFGDIALSMEDLQAAAEHIIGSESIEGVYEALSEFDDLSKISGDIDDVVKEINKANWKISIGMGLTEDEEKTYQEEIEAFVKSAQDYALQQQYAVDLNLEVAVTNPDFAGQQIVDKIKQFYSDKTGEIYDLGADLNQTIVDGFNDSEFNINPEKLLDIQRQIADIQASLTAGETEAKLSLLGMQYTGSNLSPDSFKNLQAELGEMTAENAVAYDDIYAKDYASAWAAYNEGYLTKDEFNTRVEAANQTRLSYLGNDELNAMQFQMDTIMQTYDDEIAMFLKNIEPATVAALKNIDEWQMSVPNAMQNFMLSIIDNNGLDDTTKKSIEQLMDVAEPGIKQLEDLRNEYALLNMEVPEEIDKLLSQFELIGAMTVRKENWGEGGDVAAAYSVAASLLTDDDRFNQIEEIIKKSGTKIPEDFAAGINTSYNGLFPYAVEEMYTKTQQSINSIYSKGFVANADVDIMLKPVLNGLSSEDNESTIQFPSIRELTAPSGIFNSIIGNRASGGLALRPELTWFAENGPEMAIPIDGSQHAIDLWEQTGQLLGTDSVLDDIDLGDSAEPVIEYSPTLQFYGGTPSKEDIKEALHISQEEFAQLMEKYMKTRGRVSFG